MNKSAFLASAPGPISRRSNDARVLLQSQCGGRLECHQPSGNSKYGITRLASFGTADGLFV